MLTTPESTAESVESLSNIPLIFFLGGSTPVAGFGYGAGLPSADTGAVGARFALISTISLAATKAKTIAGPKVQSLQWPSPTKARVLMDNFPMDQMPPFAAAKFMTDLKAGIDQVKTAHKIGGPVEVDICDASSGRVMQTVTE